MTAGYAECPLCGTDFESATCHVTCPLSAGCAMVRCPRCQHEFVTDGFISRLLAGLLRGRSHDSLSSR